MEQPLKVDSTMLLQLIGHKELELALLRQENAELKARLAAAARPKE